MNQHKTPSSQFGMIGLGTMGRNLLLNMAEHGYPVAGYDKNPDQVAALDRESSAFPNLQSFRDLSAFVAHIQKPRAIMMLVPAGKIVDAVIGEISPFLEPGDMLIDGGNSHYSDTERRAGELESKGLHFFGMGVSGGSDGARRGPSMMPGGDPEAYQVVQNLLESIAAKVDGEPCVTYIGPGGSGHFVKMVHNGIEYALMQLIAETYHLLHHRLQLDNSEIHHLFGKWNMGRLSSYLLEITTEIFAFKNPDTGHLLIDDIRDQAKSKGTGKWTSQIAMDLQTPIPAIDSAVSMRDLSRYKTLRTLLAEKYPQAERQSLSPAEKATYLVDLEEAFYFAMAVVYAQGMHMLSQASEAFGYGLQLDRIAKIWRGGCIIRSQFLEVIFQAFHHDKTLNHLFQSILLAPELAKAAPGARRVASDAIAGGLAVQVLTSCVGYFDAFRTDRLPTNLIQAQRDYFGAHTYELIGKEGVFHTDWTSSKQ